MNLFKLLAKSILVLVFSVISIEGADMCPAVIDGSSIFNTTTTTYSRANVYLDKFDHDYYYFDIQTAGTLTITVTSGGNKVDLAYSDSACPIPSATSVYTKVVTTTSAMDFNIALYATNDATYTISATFVPAPLAIAKTSTPTQVAVSTATAVNYRLAVRNYGAVALNNVSVTDTFPAGLTIGAITAPGWTCSTVSQTVTCTRNGGSLAAGAATDINISTSANIASSVTNTATANATGYTASSSSVLEAVSGTQTVDLNLQKFASSNVVAPNTNFAYYVFVINYSNPLAQLVKVTDVFPADANVSFVSAGGNGWTCTSPSDTNRTFTCSYGASLPKGITYFTVNAHARDVNGTYGIRNTATVSALNPISGGHSLSDYADINISTEGVGGGATPGGGYVEGGQIEVSDIPITAVYNRSNAVIRTKVAATQNTTLDVYHVDPGTGFLTNYTVPAGATTSVPLTVVFKLADETCSLASETSLSYDSTKSVAAVFSPGTSHALAGEDPVDGVNNFDLRNIAKKRGRLIMKYVDINQLLNAASEPCHQSSLDGNIKGLPQCIANSTGGNLDNNKYLNTFGVAAFMRCVTGNGNPCNASNHGVGNAPYNTEYGCYECTLGGAGWCSKDAFAIRPKQFDVNITAGSVFKAQANSFAFKALTNNTMTENTLEYNETQNSTFALDLNISDPTKSCAQMNLTISPTVSYADGLHQGNFRFSNIGDVNLTLHDILGAEFAKVDENDTAVSQRLITPYAVQFRIIPHHFAVDGNYTNAANGFTYLSNFEEYNTSLSRRMSGSLDLNITAKADDNTTTTNYTENCYAKDGNLQTGITPFTIAPAGSLTKMIWYDVKHDTNGSIPLPLPATFAIPILHTAFDSNESNGTASVDYRINFDRNQTKVVNPFAMTVGNVDMNDSDSVTGTKAVNNGVYFVYGRVNPLSTIVYGTAPFSAQSFMEVYGSAPVVIPSAPAAALSPSRMGSWWINRVHTVGEGDANVTVTDPANHVPTNNLYSNGTTTYSNFANIPTTLPFEFESHIQTMPWLWHGSNASPYVDPHVGAVHGDCIMHPCFMVKIRPTMTNWVGGGTEKGSKTQQQSTTEGTMGEDMLVPRIRQ